MPIKKTLELRRPRSFATDYVYLRTETVNTMAITIMDGKRSYRSRATWFLTRIEVAKAIEVMQVWLAWSERMHLALEHLPKIKCPACDGKSYWIYMDKERERQRDCSACDRTGWILEEDIPKLCKKTWVSFYFRFYPLERATKLYRKIFPEATHTYDHFSDGALQGKTIDTDGTVYTIKEG